MDLKANEKQKGERTNKKKQLRVLKKGKESTRKEEIKLPKDDKERGAKKRNKKTKHEMILQKGRNWRKENKKESMFLK